MSMLDQVAESGELSVDVTVWHFMQKHPGKYREIKASCERTWLRCYLKRLLGECAGSKKSAAKLAGMDRTAFRRLLQKSGLE